MTSRQLPVITLTFRVLIGRLALAVPECQPCAAIVLTAYAIMGISMAWQKSLTEWHSVRDFCHAQGCTTPWNHGSHTNKPRYASKVHTGA